MSRTNSFLLMWFCIMLALLVIILIPTAHAEIDRKATSLDDKLKEYPELPSQVIVENMPSYELSFNIEDYGRWGDNKIRLTSIDMFVDGVKVGYSCYDSGKSSSNCGMQQMIQNEIIIQQNEIMIGLYEQILTELRNG